MKKFKKFQVPADMIGHVFLVSNLYSTHNLYLYIQNYFVSETSFLCIKMWDKDFDPAATEQAIFPIHNTYGFPILSIKDDSDKIPESILNFIKDGIEL